MYEIIEDRGCGIEYVHSTADTIEKANVLAEILNKEAKHYGLTNGNGDYYTYYVK